MMRELFADGVAPREVFSAVAGEAATCCSCWLLRFETADCKYGPDSKASAYTQSATGSTPVFCSQHMKQICLSLPHSCQSGPRGTPSLPSGGREVNHSTQSEDKVRNSWSYAFTPLHVLMKLLLLLFLYILGYPH